MLDYVPNHSAVDCPLTKTNIDYFVRCKNNCDPNIFYSNGIAYGGM